MESCPRIFGMTKSMCNSIVDVSEEFQYHVIKMINVSSTKVAIFSPIHLIFFKISVIWINRSRSAMLIQAWHYVH